MHPSVAERLARLAPDQRAAATASPGPVLVVAPAGSGKTTTLVARVCWLVDGGTDPRSVTLVAFNKRAAEELVERLDAALEPLGAGASGEAGVRVRTFHALGREVLAEAGVDVTALADRDAVVRTLWPDMPQADRGRLDLAFGRLKLDLRVDPRDVEADPAAGPVARAWAAYERALRDDGALDFDDLVVRALPLLEGDAGARERWRARCATLLVDEAQDLDRTQLDLALLLAGEKRNVTLVGDDDQTPSSSGRVCRWHSNGRCRCSGSWMRPRRSDACLLVRAGRGARGRAAPQAMMTYSRPQVGTAACATRSAGDALIV